MIALAIVIGLVIYAFLQAMVAASAPGVGGQTVSQPYLASELSSARCTSLPKCSPTRRGLMHHVMHYPVPVPVAAAIIAVVAASLLGWLIKRLS